MYPGDSQPKDWYNIISSWHLPVLVSPVHDADKNGDGMEKKKHQHVMLYFGKGANKSFEQVCKYVKKVGGCQPETVGNGPGLIRYFIHRDNPEKAQRSKGMDRDWTIEDLISFAGFEYLDAFNNFASDEAIYDKVEGLINDLQISNFAVLVSVLKQENLKSELSYLRRHSIYFDRLLNGMYQQIMRNNKKLDDQTIQLTHVEDNGTPGGSVSCSDKGK